MITPNHPPPEGAELGKLVCRGNVISTGAYFMEGRRIPEQCGRTPVFRVAVNPPREGNDGTVVLCDLCNRFDYIAFRRVEFNQALPAPADQERVEP